MFAVFRNLRELVDAIVVLGDMVRQLVRVQVEAGPASDRLEALELSRHQFEAEVQGALLEARGKLKAARSSEERERHQQKVHDRLADPFAEDGEEAAETARAVQPNDVEAGEAERVPTLRLGLAPDPKAAAVMAKWSR